MEVNKRPIIDVDNSILSLAAQQQDANLQHQKKKRRHEFARMTQYTSADQTDNEFNFEGSPSGYIKKVILRNFMCHENFELELGPRLNFIVGNNGSGKSAILTAITIGMGAKASDTNRGNSLKDLIREGCNSSKIILILNNSKYGSYNQGIFGNEIIIERTIKRDGASGFSLKSENGTEISNKKKDIQAIVDFFSVPVSNPMCFLSQDSARSFLTASTSHEKYEHFMKGTLLQEINNHLDRARDINNGAQENMSLHLQNLNRLKDEYEDAKRLLNELSETTDLSERKKVLQGKSLWIDIERNKTACNQLTKDIERYTRKINEEDEKLRIRSDKIERYGADRAAIENEIEQQVLLVANKDSIHQEARDKLRDVRSRFEEEKLNQSEAQTNIDQSKKKLATLDRTIKHLEKELEREMGGDRDQMRDELIKLEARNTELGNLVNSLSFQIQDLQNDERRIAQERQSEVSNAEQRIQKKKGDIQKIAQGNNNFLNNFDDNMSRLLEIIQKRSNEFQSHPLGPLGSYVTVKDCYKEWSRSIQRAISSSLNAFVVSNQRDNKLLREIIKSCRIKSNITIFTYNLTTFDFSNGRSHSNYPSIVDVLEFSKPEIQCLFVDQNRIEKMLLIEDKDTAKKFLKTQPPNVSMALSLRDGRSGYQISGGYRLDTVQYQDKLRLKVGLTSDDGSSYLRDLVIQESQELQNIKDRYGERLVTLRSELRSIDQEHRNSRAEVKNNSRKITELKMNINKVVDTGILSSKQTEKGNQESAIVGYNNIIEVLESKLEEIAQEAQPLKLKYDDTRNDLKLAQDKLQELKEDINTRYSRVQSFKDDIKHYVKKKKSYEKLVDKINENIKSLEEGIEKQITVATEFCSFEESAKLNLPINQEDIKEELEKISRLIKKAENNIGFSQEEIVTLFEKSREKYKESQEKYIEIDKALEMLYQSIQVRLQNLQSAQRTTCLDADLDFRASLRVRNFSGNLSFITDSKRLEIFILTTNDEKARNVDTLSGGEKSFSQMALLLATWKPMRSRIIALDEFDVFMDQVNRKIGTGLIIKKLKDIARTQTIIITPQDIGKIADIDNSGVNIHKMRDPERQNNSNFFN